MRLQSLFAVVLALTFGGSAAVGVRSFVQRSGTAGPKAETVPVVVAVVDIARGGTITSELVKTRDYPKDMVPAGALTKPSEAIDRAVAIPLVKDEPVLEGKLSTRGAGRGLAALVPSGMRAVTIQTPNVASGVAGFVMPGNEVDVLLTVADSGLANSTGGGSTTTLLQKVEILAVDQRIDAPPDHKVDVQELRSVTLLVTPHQANLLDLGQNKGTLHLSLRNLEDNQNVSPRPATLADLRFHQEKPWDEKAMNVLSALAKVMAQRATPAPVPAPAAEKAPVIPPPVRLRTIRGAHEGSMFVHRIAPAAPGGR